MERGSLEHPLKTSVKTKQKKEKENQRTKKKRMQKFLFEMQNFVPNERTESSNSFRNEVFIVCVS